MPDRRFFEHTGPVSLVDLAKRAGFVVSDDRAASLMIETASPFAKADGGAISFLSDRRYPEDLKQTKAGAVFIPKKLS